MGGLLDRAELYALCMALDAALPGALFVTDCKAVAHGFKAIAACGGLPRWLTSPMSDLWDRVALALMARDGTDRVCWIPAHSTVAEVVARWDA